MKITANLGAAMGGKEVEEVLMMKIIMVAKVKEQVKIRNLFLGQQLISKITDYNDNIQLWNIIYEYEL